MEKREDLEMKIASQSTFFISIKNAKELRMSREMIYVMSKGKTVTEVADFL